MTSQATHAYLPFWRIARQLLDRGIADVAMRLA